MNHDPTDETPDAPLISHNSPSLARAQAEHANPAPTADPEIIAALCNLVELELELADCYERVAGHPQEPAVRRKNAKHLSVAIAKLGGIAPQADEARRQLLPVAPSDFEYLQDQPAIDEAIERNRKTVVAGYELLSRSDELEIRELAARCMPD